MNSNKISQILLNFQQKNSINHKICLVLCLETIIDKNEGNIIEIKDFESFLKLITDLLFNNSNEVRKNVKRCFIKLMNFNNSSEIENILLKILDKNTFTKVKKIIQEEKTNILS